MAHPINDTDKRAETLAVTDIGEGVYEQNIRLAAQWLVSTGRKDARYRHQHLSGTTYWKLPDGTVGVATLAVSGRVRIVEEGKPMNNVTRNRVEMFKERFKEMRQAEIDVAAMQRRMDEADLLALLSESRDFDAWEKSLDPFLKAKNDLTDMKQRMAAMTHGLTVDERATIIQWITSATAVLTFAESKERKESSDTQR